MIVCIVAELNWFANVVHLLLQGRCNRDKPPCKYFHPPQHLKDQLLINGRNHLALKNALMQQMGLTPGQPLVPGQVPTVVCDSPTPFNTAGPNINSCDVIVIAGPIGVRVHQLLFVLKFLYHYVLRLAPGFIWPFVDKAFSNFIYT